MVAAAVAAATTKDLVMPGREANVTEGPHVGSVMAIMVRYYSSFICRDYFS